MCSSIGTSENLSIWLLSLGNPIYTIFLSEVMTEPVMATDARRGANLLNVGRSIKGKFTPDEVLEKCGLDFDVTLEQCKTNDGMPMEGITGNMYTVRSDTNQVLGNGLSKGFGILPNTTFAHVVSEFVGHTDACITNAGSRRNGANVFMVAEMPQEYNVIVGNETPAQVYAVFQNSHDGSGSVKITFTCVRFSCMNQMPMFTAQAQIKISHTSKVEARLFNQVDKVLYQVKSSIETFEVGYNKMLNTEIDRESSIELIDNLIDSKMGMYKSDKNDKDSEKVLKYSGRHENIRDKVLENLRHESNTVDNMVGTVWAVYNAYTYYIDHQRTLNKDTGQVKPNALENAVFDSGRIDRQVAVQKCLKVC